MDRRVTEAQHRALLAVGTAEAIEAHLAYRQACYEVYGQRQGYRVYQATFWAAYDARQAKMGRYTSPGYKGGE